MNKTSSQIIGNLADDIFIYFPFWFPIIYLALIINVPQVSTLIFIAALFIFAETHFATTWLFLFDKNNFSWIKKNFYELSIQPIFIIILFILFWNFNPSIVLIIHYLASGWHVTRQSIGVSKLSNNKNKNKFIYIYFSSFLCLLVGLINPGMLAIQISKITLNISLLAIFIFYLIGISISLKRKLYFISKDNFSTLTGISIYLPLLFIKDIPIALAIGVGMHWVQYLALSLTTNGRKLIKTDYRHFFKKNKKIIYIGLFILSYSLIMTTFTLVGVREISERDNYSYLYLIPVIFQFYHFYIDRYLWRFSDPHIRDNVLPYIFKK